MADKAARRHDRRPEKPSGEDPEAVDARDCCVPCELPQPGEQIYYFVPDDGGGIEEATVVVAAQESYELRDNTGNSFIIPTAEVRGRVSWEDKRDSSYRRAIDRAKRYFLLAKIKENLEQLRALLAEANDRSVHDDLVYRFYHQSMKVYLLQATTKDIVAALSDLMPGRTLNKWFMQIAGEGTNKKFNLNRSNRNWLAETRPILEAFFHARYFLEMVIRYGEELEGDVLWMPAGWAAVTYLYDIR